MPGDEPRDYVIGLPVVITVHPGGRVTYEVDFSEAADRRLLDEADYPEEQIDLDAEAIQAWVADRYAGPADDRQQATDV